jgi:hypothetical protein
MVASPGPTLRCPFHYNEPEEPLVSFVGVQPAYHRQAIKIL